jgi:hypothetical protein
MRRSEGTLNVYNTMPNNIPICTSKLAEQTPMDIIK